MGTNLIKLIVTAVDGTTKTYTINVFRNNTFLNLKVIPVPFVSPNVSMRLEEPHRAYNYHDTIFKAIARCDMNIVYFRWDVDGNGTWDTLKHRTPVKTGNWYRDDKYNLGGIQTLPYVDPSLYGTKTFYARIEVSEDVDDYGNPVNGSIYGVYPVKVITTVPPLSNANNTSNYNLLAMRIYPRMMPMVFTYKANSCW
jgi:hypothetical protein